jgi:hypothetical protein
LLAHGKGWSIYIPGRYGERPKVLFIGCCKQVSFKSKGRVTLCRKTSMRYLLRFGGKSGRSNPSVRFLQTLSRGLFRLILMWKMSVLTGAKSIGQIDFLLERAKPLCSFLFSLQFEERVCLREIFQRSVTQKKMLPFFAYETESS